MMDGVTSGMDFEAGALNVVPPSNLSRQGVNEFLYRLANELSENYAVMSAAPQAFGSKGSKE